MPTGSADRNRPGRGLGEPVLMKAVTIRAATLADIGAIAEFQTRCWREAYPGLVPADYLHRVSAADREIRWRDRLVSGARSIAIGELAGDVVGVVSWSVTDVIDAPALELNSLYLDAAQRGTGFAAELLDHSIGDADAHLWVFTDNSRARAFYAKHRFAPDGRQQVDPGTGVPEMRYVRRNPTAGGPAVFQDAGGSA